MLPLRNNVATLLVSSIGWRSIFLVNLPIGLIGIWLTLRYAAESERWHGRGLDLVGQAAIVLRFPGQFAHGTRLALYLSAGLLLLGSAAVLGFVGGRPARVAAEAR